MVCKPPICLWWGLTPLADIPAESLRGIIVMCRATSVRGLGGTKVLCGHPSAIHKILVDVRAGVCAGNISAEKV